MRTIARTTAFIGFAAFATQVVGFGMLATRPGVADSDATWAAWSVAHRSTILVVLGLFVVGFALTVAFIVGLRSFIDDDPVAHLSADIAVATGVVLFTILAVGLGVGAEWAYRAGTLAPATGRALIDVGQILVIFSDMVTVLTFAALAIALGRSRRFPPWVVQLTGVTAAVHVGASVCFGRGGFFALDGPPTVLAAVVFWIWLAATSVAVLRFEGIEFAPTAFGGARRDAMVAR